jgi:hypothetical protein
MTMATTADRITNCARVLLALTKDWQAADGNVETLSSALAMLAPSVYELDGEGFPEPAADDLVKQSDLQEKWKVCVAAAHSAIDQGGEPSRPLGSRVVFWSADPSNPAKLGDIEGLGLNWPIQPDSHVTRVSGPILDNGKPKRLFFFDSINEQFAIEKDGAASLGLWPRPGALATSSKELSSVAVKLPARKTLATGLFIFWVISGVGLALGIWYLRPLLRGTITEGDAIAKIILGSQTSWSLVRPLIGTMASMVILMLAVGIGWKGVWFGVLVDERNRISMSRVQQAAWTIILLSGLMVIAWFNATLEGVARQNGKALSTFDLFPMMAPQLWAALGLNLVITPMLSGTILNNKAALKQGQPELALRQFVYPAALDRNTSPMEWSWLDLVTGETNETQNQIDIGRLQHLIISGGLLTSYVMSLVGELNNVQNHVHDHAIFTSMPDVGNSFAGLLVLSHAGYLMFKARDGASSGSATGG